MTANRSINDRHQPFADPRADERERLVGRFLSSKPDPLEAGSDLLVSTGDRTGEAGAVAIGRVAVLEPVLARCGQAIPVAIAVREPRGKYSDQAKGMAQVISRLKDQLPGLVEVSEGRRVDWSVISGEVGLVLPEDYMDLSRSFPTFSIDEFILVSTPSPGLEMEYAASIRLSREVLADDVLEGDVPGEHLVTGEAGPEAALLPWGGTIDGDEILWNTSHPDPEQWPVVFRGRGGGWWTYKEGMVSFLEGIYSGRIDAPGLPPSFRAWGRQVRFHGF
ncbi:hypothetical protein ACWEQL_40600 [Kitasatospora sp. NPDC004240]